MKSTKIAYWIFTILTILFMGFSAVMAFRPATPEGTAMMQHLGYPYNVLILLAVAKILAIITILVPGFPRLKEWAYAGLCFDLIGAVYAGLMAGDALKTWLPVLLGLVFIFASYFLYHRLLRMKGKTVR